MGILLPLLVLCVYSLFGHQTICLSHRLHSDLYPLPLPLHYGLSLLSVLHCHPLLSHSLSLTLTSLLPRYPKREKNIFFIYWARLVVVVVLLPLLFFVCPFPPPMTLSPNFYFFSRFACFPVSVRKPKKHLASGVTFEWWWRWWYLFLTTVQLAALTRRERYTYYLPTLAMHYFLSSVDWACCHTKEEKEAPNAQHRCHQQFLLLR